MYYKTEPQNFTNLGYIAWLWMNSKLHQKWSSRMMLRNVIPPISLAQFKIISDGVHPLGYASWAFFSADAELRYIANPSDIEIGDWNSGSRLWFIDFISPFSPKHTLRLKSELREMFHGRYARALRVHTDLKEGRVLNYIGYQAPSGWREQADQEMLSHFIKP